jgi:hypothetical protein
MSDNTGLIALAVIFGTGAIITISYFVTRWIFDIKKQLWNQKQQINLLVMIAEKLGADEYKLKTIHYENNYNGENEPQ